MKYTMIFLTLGLSFSSLLIGYQQKIKTGHISKKNIASYLPKNPIIVEAGAHIGTDTVAMAKLWPQGIIFAFEPVPTLFEQLKSNVAPYHNVVCVPKALSSTTGTSTMFISQGNINGSSSLFKPKEHLVVDPTIVFPSQIEVETITLDDWAKSIGLTHIDFLWLDMQGAEPDALRAGTTILKTVKAIYTEVNLAELYEGITLYPEFKAWLATQGFSVIQEDRSTVSLGKYANVLFCRVKKEHK